MDVWAYHITIYLWIGIWETVVETFQLDLSDKVQLHKKDPKTGEARDD
jgi:hypothetical protein